MLLYPNKYLTAYLFIIILFILRIFGLRQKIKIKTNYGASIFIGLCTGIG